MSENVTIQINLSNGEVLIQSPADSLDIIFSKLESFLPKMIAVHDDFVPEESSTDDSAQSRNEDSIVVVEKTQQHDSNVKNGGKRKKSASSKKPESYKIVDLGLSEDQRNQFREFYVEKAPKSQNEQLLVIMSWLKDHAKKDAITKDEIFTGLKTVEAKVPTRISSVLSNLGIEGKITSNNDGRYHLHHTGEDFVKFNLPLKKGKK